MKTRNRSTRGGFTLVELMISMSLGMIVMLAVFSTYSYLGRNLTRLSYRSVLETQGRKIRETFAADIRGAKSITNASATTLTLAMIGGGSVAYTYNGGQLTRDPDGSGAMQPVLLNYMISDGGVQIPTSAILPANGNLFSYNTATGNTFTTAGTGPTYQNTTTLVPLSIKQVAVNFTLQAGTTAIQGQQGTLNLYQVSSGWLQLINRQLPDGT